MKVKKVVIVISLVEEAWDEENKVIENEIFLELARDLSRIPWCRKVEKVEVVEE